MQEKAVTINKLEIRKATIFTYDRIAAKSRCKCAETLQITHDSTFENDLQKSGFCIPNLPYILHTRTKLKTSYSSS